MASSLATELSRKPPGVKAAILIGVIGVLGLLYYQFMYSGLTEDKKKAEVTKNRLQKEKNDLRKKIDEKKRLSKRFTELQKTIAANQKALPTESELPSFFDQLQKKAGEADVSIKKWTRRKEETFGSFVKVPVGMEIDGTFHKILKYFALLSPKYRDGPVESDVSERLVTVEGLELSSPRVKGNEIILTAKFQASTFRQKLSERARKLLESQPDPEKDEPGSKIRDAKQKRAEAIEDTVESAGGEETDDGASGDGDVPDDPAGAGADRLTDPGAEVNP